MLDRGLNLVADQYEIVGPIMLDAACFGAPTQRKRLFVIGVDRRDWDVPSIDKLVTQNLPRVTVRNAIQDLIQARLAHIDAEQRDWWSYGPKGGRQSDYALCGPGGAAAGTGELGNVYVWRIAEHYTRRWFRVVSPRTPRRQGYHRKTCASGVERFVPHPTSRNGNDRGSYQSVRPIHPVEDRVITVREGARLQGFPELASFFHPAVWHSFRMIGNSVSPQVSRSVLSWLGTTRVRVRSARKFREAAQ